MANDTYISFYLTKPRIHIHSKTIIDIGNPKYIRFLVKEDGSSMIMEAYHKKDFQSHRVPKRTNFVYPTKLGICCANEGKKPVCPVISTKNRSCWTALVWQERFFDYFGSKRRTPFASKQLRKSLA